MSRRPTHCLVVRRKFGKSFGAPIGVGWENDNGWINIKLNPCVVISHSDDVFISLYPNRQQSRDVSELNSEEDITPQYEDEAPF
jgi:hypothetical protein